MQDRSPQHQAAAGPAGVSVYPAQPAVGAAAAQGHVLDRQRRAGAGCGGGGGGAAPPKRSLFGWVGQGWVECDQQSPRQLPACVPCHSVQASTCRRWACHVRGGQWFVGDRVVCLAVHHAPPPAPPGGMPTTWLDQPSRHRRVDECPSLPPPDGLPFMPCPSHTPPPGFCCFCCCSLDDDKHDLLEGHLRHFAARQVSGRVGAGVGGG